MLLDFEAKLPYLTKLPTIRYNDSGQHNRIAKFDSIYNHILNDLCLDDGLVGGKVQLKIRLLITFLTSIVILLLIC